MFKNMIVKNKNEKYSYIKGLMDSNKLNIYRAILESNFEPILTMEANVIKNYVIRYLEK